jgi:uncharacterized YccA/Bax inhibitor family protein
MRTSNPVLREQTFLPDTLSQEAPMTLRGTVHKSVLLLAIVVVAAAFTWNLPRQIGLPIAFGGAFLGLITAVVLCFKNRWAPVLAPVYAVVEGLFLGGISALYHAQSNGLVVQAVMLTFGTLAALLFAYQSGLIRATQNFRSGIIAATGGIFLVYLVSMVLGFFGIQIPFIHSTGWVGIGFSLFVVTIAALNLVLDFDFIEQGAANRAPRHLEWYAAFGLLVTLVWLYLEILRLLSKLQRR